MQNIKSCSRNVCQDLQHWKAIYCLVRVLGRLLDLRKQFGGTWSQCAKADSSSMMIKFFHLYLAVLYCLCGRFGKKGSESTRRMLDYQCLTAAFHLLNSKSLTRARLKGLSFLRIGSLRYCLMPDWPFSNAFQEDWTELPSGVTAPIPVMTTLRMDKTNLVKNYIW